MKKQIILGILSIAALTLAGCGSNATSVGLSATPTASVSAVSSASAEPASPVASQRPSEELVGESNIDAVLSDNENVNSKMISAIGHNLSDNEQFAEAGWVEPGVLYRVPIEYVTAPANQYKHKMDWFFYVFEDGSVAACPVLYTVDIPDGTGRHKVYAACDFDVELADVNFDGLEDIVFDLGHSGSHGDLIHGVFINYGDCFAADYSFENIPNYSIDAENKVIRSWIRSVDKVVNRVYEYDPDKAQFVEVSDFVITDEDYDYFYEKVFSQTGIGKANFSNTCFEFDITGDGC